MGRSCCPARSFYIVVALLAVWLFCDCMLMKRYQKISVVRRIEYNSMETYDHMQISSPHDDPVQHEAATNSSNASTIAPPNPSTLSTHYTSQTTNVKLDNTIQLVVSVDGSGLLNGLVALLQSISQHSADTNMTIHIVVNTIDEDKVHGKIACSVRLPQTIKIIYLPFDVPESFRQLITVDSHPYLASTANFARFYFDRLFPSLPYILYIDVDTLVFHDLRELWNDVVSYKQLLAVVERSKPNYGIHFPNRNFSILYQERYNKSIDLSSPSFNAGILGFNLDKWRRSNVTNEVLYWMRENKRSPLWFQGSQPILYIVGYNDTFGIDSRWNVDGLGWTKMKTKLLETAHILHWSGPGAVNITHSRKVLVFAELS